MSNSILIVEDNPDNMKLISWVLEDEGYGFVGVTTAEEAIEKIETSSFDLILMDISLPGMDGKDATRKIRKKPGLENLPIIAITAHAVKGESEEIMASGVTALTTKPINEDELVVQIRNLLGG